MASTTPPRPQQITAPNLRCLGDQLGPTKQREAKARQVIDKVTRAVQNCSDAINVDRCCVTGSFGKRTALRDFDIDLVVFVNDQQPPFSSTLRELSNRLPKMLGGLEMEMTTRYSVQFCLDGFNVDLLPGPNLASAGRTGEKKHQQYETAMSKVRAMDRRSFEKDVRYWGSALAEATVDYMKEQQPFVNAAVRLAKFWKSGCLVLPFTFPKWFSSFVVEIVASDVAAKELMEHPGDASLVRVMENFLRALAVPEKLCVIGNRHAEHEIPSWLRQERPLVLNPVNPLCNLASQLSDWATIRVLAKTSLAVLEKENKEGMIVDLFQPQVGQNIVSMCKFCNFQMRFITYSDSWIRSLQVRCIQDLGGQPMKPGVEWRSKGRLVTNACPPEIQDIILRQLQDFVHVTTTALLATARQVPSREVAATSDFVDDLLYQVFNKPNSNWVPTSETHESRDVSFTFGQIPIPSPREDLRYLYLKLSVNLNDEQLYRVAHDIQREMDREKDY